MWYYQILMLILLFMILTEYYVVAYFHYVVSMDAALTITRAFNFWIGISKPTRNNVALNLQNSSRS